MGFSGFRRVSRRAAVAAAFVTFSTIAVSAGLIAAGARPASAAASPVTVYLDYSSFDTGLDTLFSRIPAVTPFTPEERLLVRAGILSGLQDAYTGFSVAFTDTQPLSGPFERVVYTGEAASPSILGFAQRLDYRNLSPDDTATVYVGNFNRYLDEFAGTERRGEQIQQLTRSLSGTGAHELGHDLGLEHYDAYGDPGIQPETYANTGGLQNTHIMATGSTGLTETQRETPRTFSILERAKLSYASGLVEEPPSVTSEQGEDHATLNTAQLLGLTLLPQAGGVQGVSLTGQIGTAGEFDLYRFFGLSGQQFTASVMSEVLSDRYGVSTVDTLLGLYDTNGVPVFAEQDDIQYAGNAFGTGAAVTTDSLLLNITLPTTGDYYLRVRGSGEDTGYYEMLAYVNGNGSSGSIVAPEPGVLALLLPTAAAFPLLSIPARRRRRLR